MVLIEASIEYESLLPFVYFVWLLVLVFARVGSYVNGDALMGDVIASFPLYLV